jgi:hypothetical protein
MPRNSYGSVRYFEQEKDKYNEHLDDSIRCAADSLDWRLHSFPCGRRTYPLVAAIRGDLFDPAFRDGETGSLTDETPCRLGSETLTVAHVESLMRGRVLVLLKPHR